MAELDPLTQVFNAQWTLLENSETFKALVPVGNRIKFNQDTVRSPEKREGITADYPEVRIIPMGGLYQLTVSSSHTRFTKRFQVQVATGDRRVHLYLYPLEIAIIAALSKWPTVMLPMTWKGHGFFTLFELGEAPEGRRETDVLQGVEGWSAMMATKATLHIPNTDLTGVE
jgi:hypothetical protein